MFRKRFLAATILIFLLGVVFGIILKNYDTFSFRAIFMCLALSFTTASVVMLCKKNEINITRIAVAIMVAAFSFGVLRVSLFNHNLHKTKEYAYKTDTATLKISEINENYIDAKILSSSIGVKAGTRVRFYPEDDIEKAVVGDKIFADIKYSANNKNSYLAKDIKLLASGRVTEHIEGKGLLVSIRRHVSNASDELYTNFDYAPGISKAVTIGDREGLNSYIFSLYKVGGISHILAISGLHITLIVMNFYTLLSGIGLRKKVSCISASVLAILYVALVGFTPGAVRSTVMILFLLGLRVFMYRTDNVTTLFIVLFILLIENPYLVLSASLQLSFLCSIAIISTSPFVDGISAYYIDKRKASKGVRSWLYGILPVVYSSLIITLVSSVFTFPVICHGFDCMSYVSPLLNLFAVPLFSYAVGFALIAYLISVVSLPLGSLIAFPAGVVFDFVTNISRKLYESGIGVISVNTGFAVIPLICSIFMIIVLIVPRKRDLKRFLIVTSAFCVSLAVCGVLNEQLAKRPFIEYGDRNGEYIYLQTENESVYVDVGGFLSFSDVVYENGKTSLDTYIVTTYDEYTHKRFDYFSSSMNISQIVLKNPTNRDEEAIVSSIKNLANERNCDIILYEEDYIHEIDAQRKLTILIDRDSLLVCYDENEKQIRFLGEGFYHKVFCDTAVAMSGYDGSFRDVECDEFYAPQVFVANLDDSTAKYYRAFEESIKLKP